jgi:hypothetical protein
MRAASSRSQTKPRELQRIDADVSSLIVDLRIVVKRKKTGEKLFEVGGKWHRGEGRYLDEPTKLCKVIWLNEAQCLGMPGNRLDEGPAMALKAWIDARREGKPRVVEIVLDGGRGSGKSHLAVLAVFIIAIAFPDARCFLVSPANTRRGELARIVRDWISAQWRAWSERDLMYTLSNGSTVQYIGADDENALKQGGYEVALLNEAQLVTSDAYSMVAGGVRNVSERPKGLLILAHNYAAKEKGEWTNDHLDKIEAGAINARHYKLDPELNDAIEAGVTDDVDGLIRSVRPDLADLDALGIRKKLGEYAARAFRPFPVNHLDRPAGGHVGSPPLPVVGIDGSIVRAAWLDVTRRETAKRTGTKDGFPIIECMDFQRRPGCVGTFWKLYEREDGKIVYHGIKCIVAGDNEDDLCERSEGYLATLGLTPRECLAICDSTGRHQNSYHDSRTKPSHAIVQEWYFTVVAPRKVKKSGKLGNANPDVEDSLSQFYDLCKEDRILVAEGEAAEWLVECLRRCKIKKRGGTIRLDDSNPGYSHPVDTARYCTWYFEPRRGPAPSGFDNETFDALREIRVFTNG